MYKHVEQFFCRGNFDIPTKLFNYKNIPNINFTNTDNIINSMIDYIYGDNTNNNSFIVYDLITYDFISDIKEIFINILEVYDRTNDETSKNILLSKYFYSSYLKRKHNLSLNKLKESNIIISIDDIKHFILCKIINEKDIRDKSIVLFLFLEDDKLYIKYKINNKRRKIIYKKDQEEILRKINNIGYELLQIELL